MRNVLENGVFYAANKLYGLTFKERTDLPKYHPDTWTYEVFDRDGKPLAIFIWDPYARAYFAAETLGVLDRTHADMFKAVHIRRSLPVQGVTPEQFGTFYAQHGVDAKQFTAMMQSFGVE